MGAVQPERYDAATKQRGSLPAACCCVNKALWQLQYVHVHGNLGPCSFQIVSGSWVRDKVQLYVLPNLACRRSRQSRSQSCQRRCSGTCGRAAACFTLRPPACGSRRHAASRSWTLRHPQTASWLVPAVSDADQSRSIMQGQLRHGLALRTLVQCMPPELLV